MNFVNHEVCSQKHDQKYNDKQKLILWSRTEVWYRILGSEFADLKGIFMDYV